jgi:Domain of unknown function (DUF5664)
MSADLKIKTAAGKAPLHMVPLRVLKGASRVFNYGAKKYAVGNFLKAAMEDGAGGRYIGAELRHMADCQGLDGQFTPESLANLDPESGLPHIDHMLCGLIMLRAIMVKDGVIAEDPGEGLEPPKVDTRPRSETTGQVFGDSPEQLLAAHRVAQGNYDVVLGHSKEEVAQEVLGGTPFQDALMGAVLRGREASTCDVYCHPTNITTTLPTTSPGNADFAAPRLPWDGGRS